MGIYDKIEDFWNIKLIWLNIFMKQKLLFKFKKILYFINFEVLFCILNLKCLLDLWFIDNYVQKL